MSRGAVIALRKAQKRIAELEHQVAKAQELIDELANQEYPHYHWDGEEYRYRYE